MSHSPVLHHEMDWPDPTTPNPTPFVRLILKHERSLMRYIRAMVPRLDDAEEVWQSTAVVLWEKFDQYDPDRDFLPWAQRFAYFETLKHRRKQARDRMVFSEEVMKVVADTHESSRDTLETRAKALRSCLGKLVSSDLSLLRARYETEISIGELAQQMDTTAKSLYRRLDRLRERLARCVRQRLALTEE